MKLFCSLAFHRKIGWIQTCHKKDKKLKRMFKLQEVVGAIWLNLRKSSDVYWIGLSKNIKRIPWKKALLKLGFLPPWRGGTMHKICKIANKHCRTRYTHIHPYIIRHVRFTAMYVVKFIYSEKAIRFCEISTVDLSYVVTV